MSLFPRRPCGTSGASTGESGVPDRWNRLTTFATLAVLVAAWAAVVPPPGVGPRPPSETVDEACVDAVFSPALPLAFPKGTSYPLVAEFATSFESLSIASVDIVFGGADPFDPGDQWFLPKWGGQRNTGASSTTARSQNPWESTTGEFLDGRYEDDLLSEDGSFIVNSVRFCVRLAPGGSPGWCSMGVHEASTYGRSTSIALDSRGVPRIAWQDFDTQRMYEARWKPSGWVVSVAGDASYFGYLSLAIDSNNRSHLAYYNFATRQVGHAWEAETGWRAEAVASGVYAPVGSLSMSLDATGDPYISYYDGASGDLNIASRSGSVWSGETIDSSGDAGFHSSVAVDKTGDAHVGYVAVAPDGTFEIRYARKVSGAWSIERVAQAGATNPSNWVSGYVSLALDASGSPRVSYFDVATGSLQYAHKDGATWTTETVDVSPRPYEPLGQYTSIAIDSSGHPSIAYYDFWNKDVKVARHSGTAWEIDRAVAAGNVGWSTGLALDAGDRAHLAYRDAFTGAVRYATRVPCPSANGDPTADAGGPYVANEGGAVVFDASGSTDPDGTPLTYRWDWDGDGTWDEETRQPVIEHVFGDDLVDQQVTLEVSDGIRNDTATTMVTVRNVAPIIVPGGLSAFATVSVSLRIAGERWHDASLTLFDSLARVASESVVRRPGSPDAQRVTIPGVRIDAGGGALSATVTYNPEDDPENGETWGATPVWIVLASVDGTEVWIPHLFNVRHPDTWTWTVKDFRPYLAGMPIAFALEVHDPGSDDLIVTIDFGDGSSQTWTAYNDGVGPDPARSANVNPAHLVVHAVKVYAGPGTYTVLVTARDDDGGSTTMTLLLYLG